MFKYRTVHFSMSTFGTHKNLTNEKKYDPIYKNGNWKGNFMPNQVTNSSVRTLSEIEIWAKKQAQNPDPLYFDKEITKAQNEMLDQIYLFAQNGSTLKTIAQSFGVDLGTLKRYFRTEMGVDALRVYEKAKAWGQLQTEETLYDMTNTGKDFQATKFWLERKAHDDWKEPEQSRSENRYVLIETCESDA